MWDAVRYNNCITALNVQQRISFYAYQKYTLPFLLNGKLWGKMSDKCTVSTFSELRCKELILNGSY